ncbi:unnamed protein product [Phytophthora lilii]|uniref:Unnamed protein product n=1 Tax=Phytophthora lilii TaxID=2077276 RepID=A0A9W6WRY8_9STRA|nr:unnamed protein product [Phytophthora lilii]
MVFSSRQTSLLFASVWSQEFDDDDDDLGADENASISTLWQRALRALSRPSPNTAKIAVCQAKLAPLSDEQVGFLKAVMEERFGSSGLRYCGWYPGLFYESREDSGKSDVIVADIHTDSPSAEHCDPGGVPHVGVGNPMMAFFVVNRAMYAGPVFSSYEFVTPIDERWTDEDFERMLTRLPMPEWARLSFLC